MLTYKVEATDYLEFFGSCVKYSCCKRVVFNFPNAATL
uniref:Uncharacterized protein n=1 Tax=Trichinella nativa TaxID=6335 RepID=A0A0V1KIM8_9BILA